jgi:hypothetical protein
MKKSMLIIFIFLFGVISGFAQEKNALFIYGNGWSFWVIEPKGWRCYTEDAYRYHMNAYFCLGKKNINNSPATMNIEVLRKGGKTLQERLATDMEDYEKQSKSLEFLDFLVDGIKYESISKIYIINDKTTDYVCFLDPSEDSPWYLVFVLHGPKDESPKYEKDFLSLIKSFSWMGGHVKGIKK